jgi:ubiquinone/menaquinone biosynthesis C-methylase UbiE
MEKQTAKWRQSSRIFHERAREYDDWFENSLLFDIEKNALQSLHLPHSTPALEIGVGPGRFAEALGIPLGLDPAFAPLLLAKSRGIIPCQAIAEELPLAPSSLGAIYLLFTLCFLESPHRFFQECRRVLRPGAPLIIGFVPAGSIWGRALLLKKEEGHPFYQSARFYTIDEVLHLFTEHGFQVHSSASTLYQVPGKVTELEEAKAGLDNQAGFVIIAGTTPARG